MKQFFHSDELGCLALEELGDGHAGPGGDDLGDVVRRDLFLEQLIGPGKGADGSLLLLEPRL